MQLRKISPEFLTHLINEYDETGMGFYIVELNNALYAISNSRLAVRLNVDEHNIDESTLENIFQMVVNRFQRN